MYFSNDNILNLTFKSFLKGKMALTYLALAKDGNTPIVSYNEIGAATGYSKKTVIDTIKELESNGLLIKLKWNCSRGESDKNCYILFSPTYTFKRDKIDEDKVEYITKALQQLQSRRDGKPVLDPWLKEVVEITPPGVEDTLPKKDNNNGVNTDQGNNINSSSGCGVNRTPLCINNNNVYRKSNICTNNGCQQRKGGVKNETLAEKPDVVVTQNPISKREIKFSYRKQGNTPWVRFLLSNDKVNKNEITVNLKEIFQVDLYMAVANATAERVYLALEAAAEYAKKTAIRNLQGLLVKAVTCGWTVGKKVFIAEKSKKQESIVVKENLIQKEKGRDKYRDLYRLIPKTC